MSSSSTIDVLSSNAKMRIDPRKLRSSTNQKNDRTIPEPKESTFIYRLSVIWFGLCTSLVFKHQNLIVIFFSFCGCFVISSLLSSLDNNNKGDTTTTMKSSSVLVLQQLQRRRWKVGIIICLLSCYILLQQDTTTGTTIWNATTTTTNNNTNNSDNDNNNKQRGSIATSYNYFLALSVMMGYLAYDMWFSNYWNLNIQSSSSSSWTKSIEDALTLTLGLSIASLTPYESYYHFGFQFWLVYKLTSLIVSCYYNNSSNNSDTSTTTTTTTNEKKTTTATTIRKESSLPTKSSLWQVHGRYYDLSEFVKSHPGGIEAIELGRGRDCTALFESYHPFTNKHRSVLQKYYSSASFANKDENNDNTTTTTTNESDVVQNPDLFYEVLKKRVEEHLKQTGITEDPEYYRTAPWTRIVYYVFVFVGVLLGLYGHCYVGSMWASLGLGLFGWLLGALGHDAGHFAVGHQSFWNEYGVWGMSFLCNPIMWQHQHTFAHHSHTNEVDADPDLHHFTVLLKVHRSFEKDPKYQNQKHGWYVILAYTFVVFGTCVWIPIDLWSTGFLYGIVEWTDRHRPLRAIGMLLHLSLYVIGLLVLPFWVCETWYYALRNVLFLLWTSGLLFGFFSQVNHLNEASLTADCHTRQQQQQPRLRRIHNPKSNDTTTTAEVFDLNSSWAVAQIETANNFAPLSSFWHVLSNGLNLQIEHHLFPSINHSHLSKIVPVVKRTCDEFQIQYKCYDTWKDVMGATLEWLSCIAEGE